MTQKDIKEANNFLKEKCNAISIKTNLYEQTIQARARLRWNMKTNLLERSERPDFNDILIIIEQ